MSFDYRQCINSVSFLRDNPIVFDVGCNINKIVEEDNSVWIENWNDDFTLLFLEKFSDAKCYAIEPLHWQEYENRWEKDCRVILFKFGLSDIDGDEVIFYPGFRHVLSSFYLQEDFINDKNVRSIKIPCKKLDTLFEELNLDYIDYLKLDTEGAEFKIISGSQKLLKEKKIKYIQFEYGLKDLSIPSVDMITEILKKYGYSEVINSGREKLWSCE